MREHMTNSVTQKQQRQKVEARPVDFTIVMTTVTLLAILVAAALFAQAQDKGEDKNKEKYSLKSPGGIAFSDFRGYEDWADVSSARTDEILKVIVANPVMIKALKTGVPGNGQPFPDGSMIVKLQWKHKKSTEAPSLWRCPMSSLRLSSSKRTAPDLRKAVGGDTRCSTTIGSRTSSLLIPKVSRTADTRAIRP